MKIAEYLAPTERLTPSNEGFSAFETAGRRIGPLYNQEAQDIKEEGRLKAQEIEDLSRWPFDILNLRNDVAEAQAAKAAKEGVRIGSVTEGYNAVSGNAGKAGKGGITDPSSGDYYSPFDQISRGAPVMAATARQLISPQSFNQPQSSTFDPNTVTTGPAYTLQNGQFVKVNNQDPNAAYAAANNKASDLADQANEWYGQGQDNPPTAGFGDPNFNYGLPPSGNNVITNPGAPPTINPAYGDPNNTAPIGGTYDWGATDTSGNPASSFQQTIENADPNLAGGSGGTSAGQQ